MKIHYPTLVAVFLFAATAPLRAQQTFEQKKRPNVPVNTSSLRAVRIQGAAAGKQQRLSAPRAAVQQPRAFQLGAGGGKHTVTHASASGQPSFISTARDGSPSSVSARGMRDGCYAYLSELQGVLGLENPAADFVISRSKTDSRNKTHVRLQQYYNTVPVYGGEVIVHLNERGEGVAFNGRYLAVRGDLSTTPSLSEEAAVQKVKSHLKKEARPLTALERQLIQYDQPAVTLYVYEQAGHPARQALAYHVVYCPSLHQRWEYFIDAHSGGVLNHYNSTCFADGPRTASANDLNGVSRTVNTYQKGATYFMLDVSRPMFVAAGSSLPDEPIGGILTIDMDNTFGDNTSVQHNISATNTWTNPAAVSAHFNGGTAYDYFLTQHSRSSINGEGGTMFSIINVPDENGDPMDNAFWNGQAIFYGNGNVGFKPLAGALDVAGHEMTHGVVQNTANLEYQGESGAINESMADIFGSMMDPADWLIGEDVVKPAAFPSGALRSLADPHNGGATLGDPGFQPKHVNEAYTGTEDNGGVHINSGIPNHAFFKYAEATTREKAADVFYKALDDYLTKSSKFIDLRLAVIQAAKDLFGAGSDEVTQAGVAFDAVGITDGSGGNYNETLPINPGAEYLMVHQVDPANDNTLYRTTLKDAEALTQTILLNKPSITDDGTTAVFIADDNTINTINTKPGTPVNEQVLQDEPIWSNVVISKGGTRLAAVTTAWDGIIYVYDFESERWGEFELYNPTYSEGVVAGGPLYADALEWDYSGEYLVYDAFNEIENSDGQDIEYWDVNFIRVWDKEAEDFGDGTIAKLFTTLPAGVSIGNPSFAKMNGNILAFDYVDDLTNEFMVLGCNIETGAQGVLYVNNTLGWPSYNKNDSRVAFTTMNTTTNRQETGYVSTNSDRVSSNGEIFELFTLTKWPVYYATGVRPTEGPPPVTGIPEEPAEAAIRCYPNPFTDDVSLKLNHTALRQGKVEITTLLGQPVRDFRVNPSDDDILSVKLGNLAAGQYILRIRTDAASGACKLVKAK